jgi:hypothetical protein
VAEFSTKQPAAPRFLPQLRISVAAAVFLCGCAQIPTAQLTAYTQAFEQARTASEQVLLDFDRTIKDAKAYQEPRPQQANAAPKGPYPLLWSEASSSASSRAPDEIEVRRRALQVVADYNAVLVKLAEGKSVEEVKAGAGGLLTSVDKFLTVARGSGVPGLSSLTGIVSTLVALFEKARLREEFVKAARDGAPIVQSILDEMVKDVGAHYQMRAGLLNAERIDITDAMRTSSETVSSITLEYKVSAADLRDVEKLINEKMASAPNAGFKLPVKLASGSAKSPEYSAVARAQVQNEQAALERLAKGYADNVAAAKALAAALDQYRKLLQAAQASLKALVKSLDEPVDLVASSDELLTIVFSLRRDLGELHAARAGR